MTRIVFIEYDGTQHEIEVEPGTSLMSAAVENDVPGIDGDCGGNCACATCHLYIDASWRDHVGPPASDTERDMIGFADGATESSRLGCQVAVTPAMDGMVVRLPLGQH
jgi:2Fe-2S ferredoxin